MKMLKRMLKERKSQPRKEQSDFFDYVLEELQSKDTILTEAIALDLMFVLLFASFETTSLAITLAIKFLHQHPKALKELAEEHEAIIRRRESASNGLTWQEYKSMKFTFQFINETVRLANIAPVIFRKALKDINFKEYTIPAGWAVMVSPPAVHLNPTKYEDPLQFNPWRWEGIEINRASRNFMAFGGGMRFCVGTDFVKVQMAVFLHCFVTKYNFFAFPDMELPEMESMATAIGVSVPVLRFLLCFVATIPVSFFHRFVPSSTGRHLYAAVMGGVLSYLSFGFSSNLHFLVPMLLGYASMVIYRPYCGIITFFIAFGYLIGCHVYYMSGDAWKEGGIDATGALMVVTLKIISSAINYQDGLLKEEDLREAQKKNRLLKLPSLLEYFGYCLCCGSHFAGPVYEMKDYLDWTERNGIWKSSEKGHPSPLGATLRSLLQAAICMGLYLYLVPFYPLSRFSDPLYQEWGFFKRLSYQYMACFTARWKYYFIWSISESAVIISGLGFSGWTDSSPPKPRWDRAKNVDVLGVELAKSSVQLPLVWNIQVSTWLRHYVYERLVQKGKKAGFFQLLATQTISAVWHGLYPGYIIFFVQSALMIAGSRVIYRWQQATKGTLFEKILTLISFAYTLLILNYSAVGFMVLSLHETLTSYGSVYYIGTVIPIVLILLSKVIKPARPARSKARKEE
uniref:Uncharacterized protein n=2 Tax=Solanum lycopersicum TaxID=4081 RepID=A0A3Q7HKY7_SOLLC